MLARTIPIFAGLLLLASRVCGQAVEKQEPLPIEGARAVLAAVVQAAERKPPVTGDELTGHYYRAAAQAAKRVPALRRADAFLLAMGVALDDSDLLRNNALTRGLWQQLETADERERRLRVM